MNNTSKRSRNNVLIITGDPLGEKMAGPAIRAINFAEQIAMVCNVRVVTTNICDLRRNDFEISRVVDHTSMSVQEAWADVIVVQGNVLTLFPKLQKTKKYLVCDLYDPMQLEQLEQGKDKNSSIWNQRIAAANHLLITQMRCGDYFLAASERQRDFWLGALATLGRVNGLTYQTDNSLKNFLTLAPFGLSALPPTPKPDAIRGKVDGISKDDYLLIWAGGLYDWFDPETLIKAIGVLKERNMDVKLFFMGTQHPHPGVPKMAVVERSRMLAEELGLLNSNVFFNSSWVEYHERGGYLLSADAGVSTHYDHIETRFSFRTRILDYLWAGLPIVTTAGDDFAELVETEKLGCVVQEKDPLELAAAIEKVLTNQTFRNDCMSNVMKVRENFQWAEVSRALSDYCIAPHYAADRSFTDRHGIVRRAPSTMLRGPFKKIRLRILFMQLTYQRLGVSGLMEQIKSKFVKK